jgi:hypothetical protein
MTELSPEYASAQHRRDLAMHNFLDLNVGQWEKWLITEAAVPPELEQHAVNFIVGLRSVEEYQLYLQSLATLDTEAIEWFVKEVTAAS